MLVQLHLASRPCPDDAGKEPNSHWGRIAGQGCSGKMQLAVDRRR